MERSQLTLPTDQYLVPGPELAQRVRSLQALLQRDGVDVAVLQQNADLGYFAGSILSGWMIVPAAGEPTLLVRRARERVAAESTWGDVRVARSTRELVRELAGSDVVGIELDVVPAAEYLKLRGLLGDAARVVDVSPLVRDVRAVKSQWELGHMRAAALQVVAAIDAVVECWQPGMREIDVALVAERALREAGHQGIMRMRRFGGEMFYGQVVSGSNAALAAALDAPLGGAGRYPPVGKGASERRIEAGELLVLDLMGACNGYLSDCTRVLAVGEPPADLAQAQAWCVDVLEQVAAAARPGVPASRLFELSLALAREAGHESRFMGAAPDQARFVGHGIGMEVDEYPFLAPGYDQPLEPGMVFALEPKLVFAGRAAVGVEDAFVVMAEGVEPLPAITRELRVLPA